MLTREKVGKRDKQGNAWTCGFSNYDQPAINFLADKVMDHFHGAKRCLLGGWILGSATQEACSTWPMIVTLQLFRGVIYFVQYMSPYHPRFLHGNLIKLTFQEVTSHPASEPQIRSVKTHQTLPSVIAGFRWMLVLPVMW